MGPACRLENMTMDYSHDFKHLFGPFYWQRGLSLANMKFGDVVVICGDMHHLSILWLAVCAKIRGIAVVWWGHHKSTTSTWIKIKIRVLFMRLLSTINLCYTKQGKDFLAAYGIPRKFVRYTGNTVDDIEIRDAAQNWGIERLSAFIKSKGLVGKKVILFCSVLRSKTRLDHLFKALSMLKSSDVVVAVIGAGESEDFFRKEMIRLGLSDRILWLGAIVEQSELAPWFLISKVFVYPGPIGLSLIHAFYYGLPVITHDNAKNHGPEFCVMQDGETGFLFKENDICDLAMKVDMILSDEKIRVKMGDAAKNIAIKNFSMEKMARNFADAIELAHFYVTERISKK